MKSPSVLLFLIAISWPSWGLPHALPVRVQPPDRAVLRQMPATVSMQFDSRLEPVFSKLVVTDAAGVQVSIGGGEIQRDGKTLVVHIAGGGKGMYHVHWNVVSHDGHRAQGSFTFAVR